MTRLVVWSDYICPFCYVGHARVERLLADYPDLEVEWRGFEIHPEVPPEGLPLERVFHPALLAPMQRRVEAMAAEAGRPMSAPQVLANSRRAHQASAFAHEKGIFDAFHDEVMRAYWERHENLAEDAVLLGAWERAGGDRADLDRFLAETMPEASEHSSEAHAAGVSGVPTFDVLGKRLKRRVVGAQPYDLIKRVVDEVRAADAAPEEARA